ncbi:PREDICTED: phosphofurin acidic cluster sorting protein 2 [Atta cephalotes]|uniref:Phosphofurin acidic cluster sorting protein 2 n=1 Tax=Atta cephalotes TaxID=12957 RepID=A0A158NAU4_ATTCE|nr:PREDICTED: phosphofurin acidic cluster sorting protein 2 [Atta cephalotes]
MAERTKVTAPATRPVPMKLFATWEVDRTPPNCIPRLCSLTLTRLIILRPLGSDLASISIAVKMQSSKRTLRSNEMAIPTGGILDTELELQFALQYPHFLKRDGNKLLILLQRRKRYKNRTMLGYKTLAEGIVNMAQVLQKQMDVELELISDKAEKYGGHSVPLARVNVVALSSQPVDHDKRLTNDPNERLCPEFSDEEEEFSSEGEAEGSDSEPTLEVHRRKSRGKIPANARQRNLKQKFIALLKRFRVSEELEHDQEEIGQKLSGGDMEIEELFNELEDLSDSGPELDTMSVSSTPKPSLRPFFSSSRSLLAPPHSAHCTDVAICNSSAKPPAPIKVIIAGGDSFINAVLRHYVDLLSFRPPDWQNYMKFLVVPLGSNTLTRYLSSIDTKYSKLFGDEWKELLEREGGGSSECAARASEYLATANTILLLPIAEAMVTYRETDDSSQIFIPFINDVRVGCPESSSSTSVDLEESNVSMSGSPPSLPPPSLPVPTPGKLTPPSSPNVGQPAREGWEPVELQLDYWSKQTQGEKGKSTLRQAFRALHVQRLPSLGEIPGHHLSMNFTTKEKKQKIMRLGKKKEKEKENEPKSQSVDGVTRLICSAKTHNIPLRVSIDGTEWYGVKFFQLSAQWQTHIKTFPIALLEYNPQQQTSTAT